MLRDGKEVSIDAVPFDSTQRTYIKKDGTTYKIDDGTSVIYAGVSGIMKGYRIFFGVDGTQVELEEGDSLTIKDNKYFEGVETVTTVYTTPTNDIDVTYNAIDIQRMNASLGSGFLEVKEDDISVSGMTVTIQPQRACIDGITVTAKEAVQIPIDNGLSQLRTDLIVLRKTQTTARVDYYVKKGELGSTTPPELEQVAMGIYEVPICSIRVNANQTTLELSNIIDMRQTKDLGVSESVANSTMKRNEFGQADISDPLDTNDEGIVNVGYAKNKAIEGYGQKTDCILKAGLNIDLEWTDTTVTLKAGSTVCYPDGTLITIQNDITRQYEILADGAYLIQSDGIGLSSANIAAKHFSSSDNPSGIAYTRWYNFETKTFYFYNGSVWEEINYCIPFVQVTVENGVITDVQKLDYVSYFGKTGWLLPNTELLVAYGFNTDGTFKTTKRVISGLKQNNAMSAPGSSTVNLWENGGVLVDTNNYSWSNTRGVYINVPYGSKRYVSYLGTYIGNGTVVTAMTLKRPFFTADTQRGIYGDTNTLPAREIKKLVDEGIVTAKEEAVTELSLTVRTTIGNTLVTNSQYQLGNRSTNIIITSAEGFGEIRFTATNDITITIPTAHRWIIGTDTSFVAGSKYIIAWDDGMWASMGIDL